jgi:hypothetical protein
MRYMLRLRKKAFKPADFSQLFASGQKGFYHPTLNYP